MEPACALNLPLRHGLRSPQVLETDERSWSIGELAEAAGVSPRALRHYESEGLLEPRERSPGGHRRYGIGEVERLHRIIALRRLGFGLQAIARMLAADNRETLIAATRQQLRRVEIELDIATRLRVRLRELLRHLEGREGSQSVTELLNGPTEEDMKIELDEIYTGLGDDGETQLGNLERVSKTDQRIEAGGDLDELGARLGDLLDSFEIPRPDRTWLERVANDLFDVGYDLAKPPGPDDASPRISPEYTAWLERTLKEANEDLDHLDSFVVSFGSELAGKLDVLRALCRRAERRVVAVSDANPELVRYLNRLSDFMFVLARRAAEGRERLWRPGRGAELAS
jgi:cob(I)alamin adenosyltransferase